MLYGYLSDEASLPSVVVGGARDDAALNAPSPFSPTHQLYLRVDHIYFWDYI